MYVMCTSTSFFNIKNYNICTKKKLGFLKCFYVWIKNQYDNLQMNYEDAKLKFVVSQYIIEIYYMDS